MKLAAGLPQTRQERRACVDYIFRYSSPIGGITAGSGGEAITGLWFDGQKYFGASLASEYEEKPLPVFDSLRLWLDIYFGGHAPDFTPPLEINATPFRRAVWEILLDIPYGETMTYGAIAARLAKKLGIESMSAQAVGGAVGHNPISLIIPCHRVIGSTGSLTGYAGGIEKKLWLLRSEGVDTSSFFFP